MHSDYEIRLTQRHASRFAFCARALAQIYHLRITNCFATKRLISCGYPFWVWMTLRVELIATESIHSFTVNQLEQRRSNFCPFLGYPPKPKETARLMVTREIERNPMPILEESFE
ncbi:unnamed protein product [Anisakis simplex]|uniref:Uncharacterized protein n=1 Tax=Anisakis simplex TaxID=6269 RepID=A0A3P6PZI9_ANISI|nr:unnamed protein product [Anisakis simplex]